MTSELFERIAFRDQKFKTARHSKDNKNWEKAKKTKNELNFDCKQAKGDYIKNKLNENKLNPRKFWEVLTPLVNPQKVKIISELSLRDADTNEIIHKENTANSMNKFYFINIGEKLATLIEPPLNSELIPLENANNNTISIDPNLTFKFRPIEQEEVWNIVKEIQTDKSSGIKNASTYFLKLAFKALIPQVTHILNTSLSSGQIPDEWKSSKVTPLFNEGNRELMNNYRPISSISLIAKLLEKCVHAQLSYPLEINKLLYPNQFGFRPGRSTSHAIATLLDDFYNAIYNNTFSRTIYIDFRKAFDTVNHKILLNKLKLYGILNNEHKWFVNYLTSRTQITIANSTPSNSLVVKCGVPQGTTLGPLLFILYANDLANYINTTKLFYLQMIPFYLIITPILLH